MDCRLHTLSINEEIESRGRSKPTAAISAHLPMQANGQITMSWRDVGGAAGHTTLIEIKRRYSGHSERTSSQMRALTCPNCPWLRPTLGNGLGIRDLR